MADSKRVVTYRLWPPVAICAPLLAGWLATQYWGDPLVLGGWRIPLGWVLVAFFAGWNGWALATFARHRTGLVPGQATTTIVADGPFRFTRNPLYVGLLVLYVAIALLAPTLWGLVLLPAVVTLTLWGAILPEERFLHDRFGDEYDDYARRVRRWL